LFCSIFRTGCFPFIKYHCTRGSWQDFSFENRLYKLITIINFGIPCLLYGLAAQALIQHIEYITDENTGRKVEIKFLLKEYH
uniref:Anoctamin n=1 Tax=Thelazia callipaeda TaxID=103827 RepID=A0A0N5CW22_THECL